MLGLVVWEAVSASKIFNMLVFSIHTFYVDGAIFKFDITWWYNILKEKNESNQSISKKYSKDNGSELELVSPRYEY